MREIKFRAWYAYPCTDLKPRTPYGTGSDWFPRWQMGIVQTYYQSKNKVRISGFQRYYNKDGGYSESKDSCDMQIGKDCILMQYTGLKDKNGKEIYFGDILQTSSKDPNTDMWEPEDWGYAVCKEDPDELGVSFTNWYPTTEEDSVFNWRYVEVIGNIYENPDLCK